jgi:hypothetical protein
MTTVTILPDSNDTTLCLRLTGTVTAEDFDRYFHQEIKKRVDKHGFFNMLVYYDADFKGWEPEAADLNFKSIIELASKPKKLAYVNPTKSKIMLMKLADPILGGEICYFEENELEQALQWIRE